MTDFTKGKWEADTIYGDHHAVFANDTLVADCICNEATARLIAAAPEMYEVLKTALKLGHLNWSLDNARKAKELLARIDNEED